MLIYNIISGQDSEANLSEISKDLHDQKKVVKLVENIAKSKLHKLELVLIDPDSRYMFSKVAIAICLSEMQIKNIADDVKASLPSDIKKRCVSDVKQSNDWAVMFVPSYDMIIHFFLQEKYDDLDLIEVIKSAELGLKN